MKRKIIIMAVISLLAQLVYSNDEVKNLFKDYFDETSQTFEFDIRNPLVKGGEMWRRFCITDCSEVKNKIIKMTENSWEENSRGRKIYLDWGEPNPIYLYFKLDEDSCITDIYYLWLGENLGNISVRKHETYKFYDNTYLITTKDFEKNTTTQEVFNISKEENALVLSNESNKITFLKNNIINENFDSDKHIYKYSFDNLKTKEEQYFESQQKLFSESIYYCESPVKETRPRPDFEDITEYNYDEDGINGTRVYYQSNKQNEPLKCKVIRKINNIGLVTFWSILPYTKQGGYIENTIEILDKPDEILEKYFLDNK